MEIRGRGKDGGIEIAYFSVDETSFEEGGANTLEVIKGREVEERPRRVKGRDERSVCSFGSSQR